jgi:hypothetical protein
MFQLLLQQQQQRPQLFESTTADLFQQFSFVRYLHAACARREEKKEGVRASRFHFIMIIINQHRSQPNPKVH